jgi:hypothetical protein
MLSPEVENVLTWFRRSADSEAAQVNTEKFAGGFLFQSSMMERLFLF